MARQNAVRSIKGESNLAQRVQNEREHRGWSYEALAKRLTEAGCSINGSALYRIEKGEPPRRITVDELIAFAKVFGTTIDEMLTPIELWRKARGKEIVQGLERANSSLIDAVEALLGGYSDYLDLCIYDPELREYIDNQVFYNKAADSVIPGGRLFSAEIDGQKFDVDDQRIRIALIELNAAIMDAAGKIAVQLVESNNRRRSGKES